MNPAGMWMEGFQSRPPASSAQTRWRPSALSRFTRVAPAVPVPTTTKSKASPFGTMRQPRPTNGIFVAMTVMVCTLASSGRLAMQTSARATFSGSMSGSTATSPFACGTPSAIRAAISVRALPTSSCPHAMSYLRPSSDVHLVSR